MMTRRQTITTGLSAVALSGQRAMAQSRFYVPAEEHPHEMTLMQWPASRQVYRDRIFLGMVQDTILEIANTIATFEPVALMADANLHSTIAPRLTAGVTLWDIPTEDLWCRDAGPIVAIDDAGGRVVQHIRFNGWGNKQVHTRDGAIAERVADRLGLPLNATSLQGEAGGLDQDGHGLLMAHESSWVNDNRNPGQSRDQIGDALCDAYGADRIIWAPGVWDEDITDYHIDSLARFTGRGRVLINLPDHPDMDDPFHQAALDTHDILEAAGLEVEVIPEPNRRRIKSDDFVASYANYYVCNGAVISAQFGDPETDAIAADALTRHYPNRQIVQLNQDSLGEVGGGIHCATQQVPTT